MLNSEIHDIINKKHKEYQFVSLKRECNYGIPFRSDTFKLIFKHQEEEYIMSGVCDCMEDVDDERKIDYKMFSKRKRRKDRKQ